MRRLLAVPSVALAALLLGEPATPVAAQDPGAISGTLLDQQTLLPIADGVVTLVETGIAVRADEEGRFLLPEVDPGPVRVRVTAARYSGVTEEVDVGEGEQVFAQFHLLPVSAMLAEVMVLTGRRGTRPPAGSVPVVVVTDGAEERAETAADLLVAQVPGLTVLRSGGSIGSGAAVRIRGVSTITQRSTPSVYLDGVRLGDNGSTGLNMRSQPVFAVLDEIPASQVKRIRVLRGSSAGAMYGDSANGIILIETHATSDR